MLYMKVVKRQNPKRSHHKEKLFFFLLYVYKMIDFFFKMIDFN